MIALDTNVLVRYLVRDDDERQTAAATKLIETECSAEEPGFIGLIVLAETVRVLDRAYGYGRTQIERVLRKLLTVEELRVENSDLAWRALNEFQNGSADFPDYLVGLNAQAAKAEVTCTFDRRTGRHPLFRLVKA